MSTTTVHEILVPFYAQLYGVSQDELDRTIKCESKYQSWVVGDHGTSYGLAQIHNPLQKSPAITVPQALNAFFALDYMARGLKYGTDHWSCSRILGFNTS